MRAVITLYLPSIKRLALDTTPLIYYIQKNPTYLASMTKIMEHISGSNDTTAYASVIALEEVLVQPLKFGDTALAEKYENILTNNDQLRMMNVTPEIVRKAAELRAKYGGWLKTPDAIHIATAIVSKCEVFLTNDHPLKKIGEIRVICLSEFPEIITNDRYRYM